METMKKRSEMDARYLWKLEDIYACNNCWEADYKLAKDDLAAVAAGQGTLGSAEGLFKALKAQDEAIRRVSRLYTYARMRRDEDNSNTTYQALADRAQSLYVQLGAAMAYFTPELLSVGKEKIDGFYAQEAGLAAYRRFIDATLRMGAHTLTPAEEKLLAQAGENTMQSHLLPQDMSVCLTGRGAWLLDTLPHVSRSALERLTHLPLRLEHPVRFITLRTAASPAQSVAMGLTVTREMGNVADAPIVRTRESFSGLMQRLMLHLCAAFPMHMWLLHEGLYDYQTGALTLAGEDSIRRAAALCYDEEEEIAPMVTTFVRLLRENPILPDSMIDPGA